MNKLLIFFIITCLSSYLVYINTAEKYEVINKSNIVMEEYVDENIEESNIQNEIVTENLTTQIKTKEDNYEETLIDIEIPKINLKGKIYAKNSKLNDIDKNIIIMKESDYPDKESGIVIIGAHSGIGKYAYFKHLNKLEENDYIYLTYNNNKYSYKVINTYLDSKDGYISISNIDNKNKLFLYTCNPNDKEHYLVIECER